MNKLIVVFAFLLFTCTSRAGELSRYSYVNLLDPETRVVIDASAKKVILGDVADSMNECERSSGFYCIKNTYIYLAVPRETILPTSWEFEGQRFDYAGEQTFAILGRKISVSVISVVRQNVEFKFYYSKADGLLAFEMNNTKSNHTSLFVTERKNGYTFK